jgi:membrane protein implicated in regulation of membrane protease activity
MWLTILMILWWMIILLIHQLTGSVAGELRSFASKAAIFCFITFMSAYFIRLQYFKRKRRHQTPRDRNYEERKRMIENGEL